MTDELPKIAYTLKELVEASGISRSQIYRSMRANELCPQYTGARLVFSLKEAERWISSLPTERPTR